MKLRNKEINIFSMSALDLFASGMGAFILLAVISLPFFANTQRLPPEEPKVCPEVKPCPKIPVEPKPEPQGIKKLEDIDIVIVLDITGSMDKEIESLKTEVVGIGELLDYFTESATLRVVTFGDEYYDQPVWSFPLTSTKNIKTIQNYVAQISKNKGMKPGSNASPGEAVFAGFELATKTRWRANVERRVIVIVTDDEPHSGEFSLLENTVADFVRPSEKYTVAIRLLTNKQQRVSYYTNLSKIGKGPFLDSGSLTSSILLSLLPKHTK